MKRYACTLLCACLLLLSACSDDAAAPSSAFNPEEMDDHITVVAPLEIATFEEPCGETASLRVVREKNGQRQRTRADVTLTLPIGWYAEGASLYDGGGNLQGQADRCVLLTEDDVPKFLLAPADEQVPYTSFLALESYTRADGVEVHYAICESTFESDTPQYLYHYVLHMDEDTALVFTFYPGRYNPDVDHTVYGGVMETVQIES